MTATANTMLLVWRLRKARRLRETILGRQEQLRGSLPQWALAPLRLVGLTTAEVDELACDRPDAERRVALDEVGCELERLDQQIEELEDALLDTSCGSLAGIQAVLDVAVTRLRTWAASDQDGAFQGHDSTRILALLDAAAEGLAGLLAQDHRLAG